MAKKAAPKKPAPKKEGSCESADAEISSLRRCREAWDAVRKWNIRLVQYVSDLRTTWVATDGNKYSHHKGCVRCALCSMQIR